MTAWCVVAGVLAAGSAAGAAPWELTISDNVGRAWVDEPIDWELALKAGEWRGGALRVLRDGKAIAAQVHVATRHGDGSVESARITFVIDRLAKGGSTRITAEPGKAGPAAGKLSVAKGDGFLVLANAHTAVKVIDRNVAGASGGAFSPILGVRTASGKWTGGGHYRTAAAKPTGTKTQLVESGGVRLVARVTTTFANGRTHVVTVSLTAGSRSIDVEESFDLGPEAKYRYKEFKTDRDELAWEWWSWYGGVDGLKEDHPNYWVFEVSSDAYGPKEVRYHGSASTDVEKGSTKRGGGSSYTLSYAAPARLEKYLAAQTQWRPDAVLWYATSPSSDKGADVVAVFTHSPRRWRNPNVHPLTKGITLRTAANDMRIVSRAEGRKLLVKCPIGLGRRAWGIHVSTVGEAFSPHGTSPDALSAERVRQCMGLDITRKWVTDWPARGGYPRLFMRPQDREAYYKRLKGVGVNMNGHTIDTFLRKQDRASFDRYYAELIGLADKQISGYWSRGMDTNTYPGWMLGYWHGIVVAVGLDNLAGHPLCPPGKARDLRRKVAILTYCLASKDAWPDKHINYGWGSMNMPVGRWGGLVVMASSIADHPMARTWLKDAGRYFRMLLETEYSPDGVGVSCPHYIGASSTSFYAWLAMSNSGLGADVSTSPRLRNFARYYMQLMTPIDKRWGIRTLLTEGDGRPGSSPLPGVLASLFGRSAPDLAGQLMRLWIEGGRDAGSGMGVPDMLIIDPTVKPVAPKLGPEVFPGFGAILRYRKLATPEEAYLTFMAGNFMIDHANTDQMAFSWYEKGVPLTLYTGDMYVPGAVTALSHNTLCWDVRPEGKPTPGKGKPGDWYHDHHLPWVPHARRPRLHLQIGWDKTKQEITDTRGMVTVAADLPGAALLEGRVKVLTLTEVPTRANYSTAMQHHIPTPLVAARKPFTWTRRLLYVKAPAAAGMNYLVVRDDLEGFAERTANFNYWSLSDAVELRPRGAHFRGQLGVDTDLFVAVPREAKLFSGRFTHGQCEPIVGSLHAKRGRGKFSETQVLARVEGRAGEGFLVVVFPRAANEPAAKAEAWLGGAGVKVTWRGETHYVLLEVAAREVDTDGIRAKTSCLVVKVKGDDYSVSLPAGGTAKFRSASVNGAAGTVRSGSKERRVRSKNLLSAAARRTRQGRP